MNVSSLPVDMSTGAVLTASIGESGYLEHFVTLIERNIVVDYVSGSSLLWDSSGSLYGVFGHMSQPVLFVWCWVDSMYEG